MNLPPTSPDGADPSHLSAGAGAPHEDDRIGGLLNAVDDAASSAGLSSESREAEHATNQQTLVDRRLGMASALFAALRCKHPATAAHSLRVALRCSGWASTLGMPDRLRTQLETAALMHDIGKIAVPDTVLLKPGRLSSIELEAIDNARESARVMLRAAGASEEVIQGVASTGAWHDGSHRSLKLAGGQTPFVSRMIAIVDAYDSMTTDQVYRPARSHDRAIASLYDAAGTQFDPDLVNSFCEHFRADQSVIEAEVSRRWLSRFDQRHALFTNDAPAESGDGTMLLPAATSAPFLQKLVENMHDAVVFVDAQKRITEWNTGATRMTGVGQSAAIGNEFRPTMLGMAGLDGALIPDEECPIAPVLSTGLQTLERVGVIGRDGQRLWVDLHVVPVQQGDHATVGASILMRDVSSEATLEERCQSLRAEMTKDPMTKVANRAEFDRMLGAFVEAHLEIGFPCSLVMTDIDHFKKINDTHGHQAGDAAIISFASLLKSMCRSGDLVARYGGEEFAILCADCNNATAAERAEEIRRTLSETVLPCLGGRPLTASFGVTELQHGDTAEVFLRRSDRALMQAKDQGRNQVVQLGNGMAKPEKPKTGWFDLGSLFKRVTDKASVESELVTNVPIELAVEKIRGFIADHQARILKAEKNHLRLEVTEKATGAIEDRPLVFKIDMRLSERYSDRTNSSGLASGRYVYTQIDTSIELKKERNRRQTRLEERLQMMLGSMKSYLMAKERGEEGAGPVHEQAEA